MKSPTFLPSHRHLAALFGALISLPLSGAVDVDWETTGALNVGESAVNTTGAAVYAYNLGSASSFTVNGISFDGTNNGGVADLNGEGNVVFNPIDNGQAVNGFSNLGEGPSEP